MGTIYYTIHIYTLLLEGGYYYVGRTSRPEERLKEHGKGKGSAWTNLHPVVEEISCIPYEISSLEEEDKKENMVTLKLMREKGWKNVRGGFWINISDRETLKSLQYHRYYINIDIEEYIFNATTKFAYVLELKNKKYFLGVTKDLDKALKEHQKGKSSKWTKRYPPIGYLYTKEIILVNDALDFDILDELFLRYGKKVGFRNIRGGRFNVQETDDHLKVVKRHFPKFVK